MNLKHYNSDKAFYSYYFIIYFGLGSFFSILSVYLQESMNLTPSEIGFIISLAPIISIVSQPLWGILSDYLKRPKKVLLFTTSLSAILIIIFTNVSGIHYIAISYIIFSIFQSSIMPLSDGISLHYVKEHEKLSFANIRVWGSIGFACACILAGKLADTFSITLPFYIFSLSLIVSLVFLRKLPNGTEKSNINIKEGLNTLFKIPEYLLILCFGFIMIGTIFGIDPYINLNLIDLGGTVSDVGLLLFISVCVEIPFMIVSKKLSHKFGYLKLLFIISIVSSIRIYILTFDLSILQFIILGMVRGSIIGLLLPTVLEYISIKTNGQLRITAVSIYAAVTSGISSWLGTISAGIILENYSYSTMYLMFSIISITAIIICYYAIILQNKKHNNY